MAKKVGPTIFLDVDGVLNPFPFDPKTSPDWNFLPTLGSSDGWRLNISKEMGDAILEVAFNHSAEIMWLTTWGLDANKEVGKHVFGTDFFAYTAGQKLFWKLDIVRDALSFPGEKVVWIDDDICEFLSHFGSVAGGLDAIDPYNRLFVCCPRSSVGLTREGLKVIADFLGGEDPGDIYVG